MSSWLTAFPSSYCEVLFDCVRRGGEIRLLSTPFSPSPVWVLRLWLIHFEPEPFPVVWTPFCWPWEYFFGIFFMVLWFETTESLAEKIKTSTCLDDHLTA